MIDGQAERKHPNACLRCLLGKHRLCQVANCGCGCLASARWMHWHVKEDQ